MLPRTSLGCALHNAALLVFRSCCLWLVVLVLTPDTGTGTNTADWEGGGGKLVFLSEIDMHYGLFISLALVAEFLTNHTQ